MLLFVPTLQIEPDCICVADSSSCIYDQLCDVCQEGKLERPVVGIRIDYLLVLTLQFGYLFLGKVQRLLVLLVP